MKTLYREVIEQGWITVQAKQCPYVIRLLEDSDLWEILRLQNDVLSALTQKEFCVPIPEYELRQILEGKGESLGFFIGNKLYAVCSLLFPVSYDNNMARELNFSDEDLLLVSQLELSLVDLNLRGLNLQQRLAGVLARRAEKRKKSRYLFTTVSPYNYPSIKTVTSLGLQIAKVGKMYYDWDRYVVYKDFINPIKLDTENYVSILNTSLDQQQELLNQGYRGFSQFKDKEGIKILFAKII